MPLLSSNAVGDATASNMGRSNRRLAAVSCYDVSLMPSHAIRKRQVHAFSVHFSIATSKWITTLARPSTESHINEKRCCASYVFETEKEARKFAKSYSPPKVMTGAKECMNCSADFNSRFRSFNCKNCGTCICEKCSKRWCSRMIPKTYVSNQTSLTVRVCNSCDWLSNAFCLALLQGKYEDAVKLFDTGNVNLRSCFAAIHGEAMFPIHCAVMGGNLNLVKWLVETHGCPVSVKRDPRSRVKLSVQTSASRTLIDLAMTGKPKIDILSYLVKHNDLSISDTKDPSLAPKTLQSLMRAGFNFDLNDLNDRAEQFESLHMFDSSEASVATIEDPCVICCEKAMDCVLTPCGHQVCCSDCGGHLTTCPICKIECSVLRIYRP